MTNTTIMPTYGRLPVNFTKGKGAWLWDENDKQYLDALAGIAVCSLGHTHPAVTQAVCDQANTLVHTSNLYGIQQQSRLADSLTRLSGMDNVFFSNSGAEANEAAIKIARRYGNNKGVENPCIVVMDSSFHGRTLATLSATGNRKVHAGFEPLVQGFLRVGYGDMEALNTVAANRKDVVAVMLEPVQGEGGVNIPPAGYLKAVRELCDAQGWLMMLDEIQTGIGRTGKMFAFQHEDITPDVMTLAKALGNGVPIGACVAKGEAAETLVAGTHGSTYGGNPLACAAANAVIDTMEAENLPARAAELGDRMQAGFEAALADVDAVSEIRHHGLMVAVQLDRPCAALVGQAVEAGLLINVTADSVIRLLPPLILTDDEADQIVAGVSDLVKAFVAE